MLFLIIKVLLSFWFIIVVVVGQQQIITREYFAFPELPQDNCRNACINIGGRCNEQRINQLALSVDSCQEAVIAFVEWINDEFLGKLMMAYG